MIRRILALLATLLLAAVFLAACVPKILHPHDFALAIYRYQLAPSSVINLAAIYLPWLELTAALALLFPRWRIAAAWLVVAMLLLFIVAVSINLYRGLDIACGCFTLQADAHKMGWWNVARNVGLLAAAGYIIRKSRHGGETCGKL